MAELAKDMPEGVTYQIVYDPTQFVRASIHAVIETLLIAILLVVIVVIVFLQTWRASIIPLLAVPVSVIGTFGIMFLFGFSINALSLFGLVLAIGIVVDDAIVVVENVERNIEAGLSAKEASYKAMTEVSEPIIAIALTLSAVFVPLAFVSGLSGMFFKQFALTIAFSTVISAFNSLTLSPALAALLLKNHNAPKDWFQKTIDFLFGWFFRPFNWVFKRGSNGYSTSVGGLVGHKALMALMLLVYAGLIASTLFLFHIVPPGFVPPQDKQYLISFAQLPQGSTLDRTEAVIRKMSDNRAQGSRRRVGRRLPRSFHQWLHQHAQRWHRLRHAQGVRAAHAPGPKSRCDCASAQRAICSPAGCVRAHSQPPARDRHRHRRRVQAPDRGPHRAGQRRAQ